MLRRNRPVCVIRATVVAAGAPTRKNLLHRRYICSKQVGERLQVGRERNNVADIQVTVCLAVQTVTYSGNQLVINRRVTEGTLNSD
jgi:hypothetical protein